MRLPRLLVAIFGTSVKRELAFRASLVFQLITVTVGTLTALATIAIVYTQTATLGGWTRSEAIVLLGTYVVLSGLLATFIEPNVRWFSNQVTNGRLDDILLRPVPSLVLATLGNHAPVHLLQVLAGAMVVGFGLVDAGAMPTVWQLAGWLAMTAAALAITWATRTLVTVIALWAPSLTLDVVYEAVWQFGRYPVSMYRQPFRFTLTWVVPLAFITTLPARALTRGLDPIVVLASVGVALVAILIVRTMWNLGLRRYTSATS